MSVDSGEVEFVTLIANAGINVGCSTDAREFNYERDVRTYMFSIGSWFESQFVACELLADPPAMRALAQNVIDGWYRFIRRTYDMDRDE